MKAECSRSSFVTMHATYRSNLPSNEIFIFKIKKEGNKNKPVCLTAFCLNYSKTLVQFGSDGAFIYS